VHQGVILLLQEDLTVVLIHPGPIVPAAGLHIVADHLPAQFQGAAAAVPIHQVLHPQAVPQVVLRQEAEGGSLNKTKISVNPFHSKIRVQLYS
jgi:hypothetical protein